MKSKKGISPLIATVLLIGFTIVLAALVMRWGGQFFRQQTDVVGCESEGQIRCTSGIDMEVRSVFNTSATEIKINVLNNGNYEVGEMQYIAIDDTGVTRNSTKDSTPIPALEGGSATLYVGSNHITQVKVVPILDYEMKDGSSTCVVYCPETVKSVDVTPA